MVIVSRTFYTHNNINIIMEFYCHTQFLYALKFVLPPPFVFQSLGAHKQLLPHV